MTHKSVKLFVLCANDNRLRQCGSKEVETRTVLHRKEVIECQDQVNLTKEKTKTDMCFERARARRKAMVGMYTPTRTDIKNVDMFMPERW